MTSPAVPHETGQDKIFLWVHYRPEEVNEGYWYVYKALALPRALITIFGMALVLGGGAVVSNYDSFLPQVGSLLFILVALLIPPLLCLLAYMVARNRLMHSYESRPNFHFPMTYLLDQLGCQVQYASGAGLLEWRHFILAVETPSAFLLASSVEDVFVLPKRCLESGQEVDLTRALLKKYVRNFRRASGKNVEIAFEKARVQQVIIDGIEQVLNAAVEAEEAKAGPTGDETEIDTDTDIDANGLAAKELKEAKEAASPLHTGLAVEISYQSGEILAGENIFFFRKRLITLVRLYILYLLWLPLSFFMLGYVWGMLDYCREVMSEIAPFIILILPAFILHAAAIYLYVRRRTAQNEQFAVPFVFQFSDEGCGIRAGDRYAVLAWWHFKECWETEDQFLLLVGKRSQAMYIVPKRVFPDQAGLRYLRNLLQRKITNYKDLIG